MSGVWTFTIFTAVDLLSADSALRYS